MRYRLSRASVIFIDGGQIVWDGYLAHKQFALTQDALHILLNARTWATWGELVSAGDSEEQQMQGALVRHLVDEGVLVEEGSATALQETALLAWDEWGSGPKHYHFSSRILKSTALTSPSEDVERLKAKATMMRRAPLGNGDPDDIALATRGGGGEMRLREALSRRRTQRNFEPSSIEMGALSDLLDMSARYTCVLETADGGLVAQRTSPSAGSQQSTDVYVMCADVAGLPSGAYAYHPDRHALSLVSADPPPLAKMLPEQTYYQRASAFVVFVGNVPRMQWKYDGSRSYRSLLLDAGHLSQTFYLSCTALGLAVGFSGAVCDEAIEEYLGLDPYEHLVFGVTAIGNAARGGAQATREALLGARKPPE